MKTEETIRILIDSDKINLSITAFPEKEKKKKKKKSEEKTEKGGEAR